MKRLFVVLTLILMSLNFIACSQKKESKTRLTKGSGRESGISQTAASSGWSLLNRESEETELYSANPDAAARAFIGNDEAFVNYSQINSIVMRLQFSGGRLVPNKTMAGFRFYDDWADPLTYFLGSSVNNRVAEGNKNGNRVIVIFQDFDDSGVSLGTVTIDGEIQGPRFVGVVQYAGGTLGEFNVSASRAIFGY